MNLHLREIDGILYLYDKNGDEREYSDNLKSDIADIISYFKSSGFQLIYHNDNLILKNVDRGFSLVVYDYKHVLKYPVCSSLNNMIMYHRQKYGAINKNTKNLSKKKTHNSKAGNRVVKNFATFLIAGALVASIGVSAFGDNGLFDKKNNVDIQEQIYLTELDIPEAPLNIRDIGTSLDEEIKEDNLEVEEIVDIRDSATLEYERLYDTSKAIECKNNYYDLIKSISSKYGLDANMMLGIATQERGVHSREIDDGGAVGLMQIQYDVYLGETVYYQELGDDGQFHGKSLTVTDDMMRDLKSNIKLSCIIMQNCLKWSNYNIPLAIQMYNQGYGAIHDLLESNFSNKEKIVNTPTNLDWYKYTNGYAGDPMYLEHILQWCENTSFSLTDYRDGSTKDFVFETTYENVR